VVDSMVEFWLNHAEGIQKWKNELEILGKDNLIVARVANVAWLRYEFEELIP
jgi:hypothetical protein